jgi:predicted O-methyltransferase YrrM
MSSVLMPDVVRELCDSRPRLHGSDDASPERLGLRNEMLRFLGSTLTSRMRTLETGCGYSTILFAVAGSRHVTVSPCAPEHARVARFCSAHGVSTDQVTFVAASSLDVLPAMNGPLDLVLIDGWHAFPAPFIDWYYTANRLEVGGLCVVDDTNIVTGRILRDFLAAERGRWTLRHETKRTSVFEKKVPDVLAGVDWPQQPYCARKVSHHFPAWLRRLW